MTYANLKKALDILAKYDDAGEKASLGGADHDVVYISLVNPEDISEEHREVLDKCGLHYSVALDCWVAYV